MLEQFDIWWNTLTFLQQIYWGVSIPSTFAMIIVIIMTLISGDLDSGSEFDVDGDGDFDADDVASFNLFSLKNIIGFLTIFGWTGLGLIEMQLSLALVLGVSFVAGFIMMLVMAWTWYMLSKLTSSGTMKIENAINAKGKAYLPIKSERSSTGKVQVIFQDSMKTMNAVTDDIEDINTGEQIRVIGIKDENTLIVTKEFS